MERCIEYIKNLLAVAVLASLMLIRSIILIPVQALCWIGKNSLAFMAIADIALAAALLWLLKVTGWSFWGHW